MRIVLPEIRLASHPFAIALINWARAQKHVRETSPNRGPEVDGYLRNVGLDPEKGSYPWCRAFTYTGEIEAWKAVGYDVRAKKPFPRTALVHRCWELAPEAAKIRLSDIKSPLDIPPGSLGLADHGHRKGHVWINWAIREDGLLSTIEGNTNVAGAREGIGVFERERSYKEATLGFIDWTRVV